MIKASVFFRFTRIHVVFKLYISNIRVLPDTMLNCCNQVSAVTDQAGVQVSGVTTGDLDDDEGGGLVGAISGDTSRTGNSLIIFDIYISSFSFKYNYLGHSMLLLAPRLNLFREDFTPSIPN